jgi:hypothetical protein
MSRRLAILALTAALIGLPAGAARALNLISLTPVVDDVSVGETVLVLVQMQFDDSTIGGGIEVLFDQSILEFSGFDFDPGLGDDPAFRLMPSTPAPGQPLVLGFGEFSGLGGTRDIGTLRFEALGLGVANLTAADNGLPVGPFVSAVSPPDLLLVDFEGSTVTVVPEPGTLALLILGSGGLLLHGSRRRPHKSQ